VVLATLNVVRPYLPQLSAEAMSCGLSDVQWPGRLQTLHERNGDPTLLADGAHNADSAQKLAAYLEANCNYRRLWLILGITADKNVPGILAPLLPLAEGVIVTKADNPRATETSVLQQAARELGYAVQVEPDIAAAVIAAWKLAKPGDLICVAGSLYIVGDLLNCWDVLKSHLCSDQVTHS
jgi:dihydrofolate synthase/folylpolyglutamate synthase